MDTLLLLFVVSLVGFIAGLIIAARRIDHNDDLPSATFAVVLFLDALLLIVTGLALGVRWLIS